MSGRGFGWTDLALYVVWTSSVVALLIHLTADCFTGVVVSVAAVGAVLSSILIALCGPTKEHFE